MHIKRLLVFAAIAVSMLTAVAATESDGASLIDSTSNSVYSALCAAGKTSYCDKVKADEPAGTAAAAGDAATMDPTRDGIYTALCAAGKTAYCGKTDASQTNRDNAVQCILGNTKYCNQGGSTPAATGAGTTGCATFGGGSGCADGSTGTGTTGTGTGALLDTSTGTAVYDAMCKAGLQSYCGKTADSTKTTDQTAYDNSVKCALGMHQFCNQPGTGTGGTTGTGTTGCATFGGGSGCADGSTGTGTTGTGTAGTGTGGCVSWGGGSGCATGQTGTGTTGAGTGNTNATNGIEDPAKQQAVNDVLCKAGQKAYCTGGTTPTSGTSGGSEGWQALMPELPVLEGDAKTACEVILCLAAGQRPDECIKPLDVFFSIVKRTLSRTISARKDFLEMCPVVKDNDFLKQLTSAQAQGAGRCDVAALNQNMTYVGGGGEGGDSTAYVSSSMPSYCGAMANLVKDPLTGQSTYPLPVFVGVPERGGYWVEPKDYATALARYTARVKAEDLAASQGDNGGGGP